MTTMSVAGGVSVVATGTERVGLIEVVELGGAPEANGRVASVGGAGTRSNQIPPTTTTATETAATTRRPAPNHRSQARARSARWRRGKGRGGNSDGSGIRPLDGSCGTRSSTL